MSYAAARINLETELKQAVKDGGLTVRNAAGLGCHTFAHGDALQRAVMLPQDLRPFLAERGIELRLTRHGSGPDYWTLENAAAAMAEQEQWHDGTRAEYQDQLQQAAVIGGLVILNPRTCLPIRTEQVHTYWELVTPESVNNWLEKQGAPYRWSVPRPEVKLEPQDEASSPASDSDSFPWPRVMHGQRVWKLSEAIDEIARALEWHSSQRDRLMAQAVKDATADVLVLRDLYAGGIMKRGDHMSELLDYVFSRDMNAWLDSIGAPFAYRLPEAEPVPEPQDATSAPVAGSASNDATPDPERRLALLRALGGSATYRRNEWKFTGIAALVASEKSEGRKRSDEKTIRADLKEAAQNELDAKRAGFGSGLGQR